MLILTRNIGEKIMIGDDIVIKLMGVEGRRGARIGIDAPEDVSIDREEVRERKIQDGEYDNGEG